MSLRVAMLGDIVGAPGRLAVSQLIPVIKEKYMPDLILANVENVANGSGLTPSLYKKLSESGIDGMTLGDHAFRKKQVFSLLENENNIIRPFNLASGAIGKGWMELKVKPSGSAIEKNIYVITVLGRLFMSSLPANDPFACVDEFIARLPEKNSIVIVEIHGETTSEKVAMGWHCNGKVAAVLGTHTHVATADCRLLPKRFVEQESLPANLGAGATAYITDLGMCGPHDSVLGRRVDRVLSFMTSSTPKPFDVASGNPRINGALIDIDQTSGLSTSIERIELEADVNKPPFVVETM